MRNLHVNIPPVCRVQLRGREIFVLLKRAGGGRCQSRGRARTHQGQLLWQKKKKATVALFPG